MRLREFITEYSQLKTQQAHRDGLDLEVRSNDKNVSIYAYSGGKELAHVHFDRDNNNILPYDLEVGEDYRGQGIAAVMYDYAKELGYRVERGLKQTDAGKYFWDKNRGEEGLVWEAELDEIARIPQSELGDWGEEGTIVAPEHEVEKKELPGGSGFTYAVDRTGQGNLEIMIFDGEKLAAELDLFETQDVLNTWGVETVVVERPYRGRGLGKALYGIALSILKLTIEAGQTQTKHGQQMWLMLNSIPGVEVKGYNMVPTAKYQPHPGDKIIDQNKDWTRYIFPVKPGKQSMQSGRRGTGLYTSQATMIAKWTGQ
jgi:GNAT superfamily N-acetyltransferase